MQHVRERALVAGLARERERLLASASRCVRSVS